MKIIWRCSVEVERKQKCASLPEIQVLSNRSMHATLDSFLFSLSPSLSPFFALSPLLSLSHTHTLPVSSIYSRPSYTRVSLSPSMPLISFSHSLTLPFLSLSPSPLPLLLLSPASILRWTCQSHDVMGSWGMFHISVRRRMDSLVEVITRRRHCQRIGQRPLHNRDLTSSGLLLLVFI